MKHISALCLQELDRMIGHLRQQADAEADELIARGAPLSRTVNTEAFRRLIRMRTAREIISERVELTLSRRSRRGVRLRQK